MDFFKKNQILIFRVLGSFMFLLAFVLFFWITPKEGLSANEKAARNVARMEASAAGSTPSKVQNKKQENTPLMHHYKKAQAKQMRYALIIAMLLGAGFLGYSFIKKEED